MKETIFWKSIQNEYLQTIKYFTCITNIGKQERLSQKEELSDKGNYVA